MISGGFRLTRVALLGPSVPTAEIALQQGLNVISGPSDTGKTYIAQCIDFVLGAGNAPKRIPEATGYNRVSLTIQEYLNGRTHELERPLDGGEVLVRSDDVERVLAAKHDGDKVNTISGFLLELSKLRGRRVLVSKTKGSVRPLSFRDLSSLILIDEESIISQSSPVVTGQYTTSTVEAAVFRLLLTGRDDSGVVQVEDSKTLKTRRGARVDVLDELLLRARSEFGALKIEDNGVPLDVQLERIRKIAEEAASELSMQQENLSALENRRRETLLPLRRVQSRLDVLMELQQRFMLLEDQYTSDLRRLDAISEAGFRLSQMLEERCPVCGALPEHHVIDHQRATASPEDVVVACRAEAKNIRLLLNDLHETIEESKAEVAILENEATELRVEFRSVSDEIQQRLQPLMQAAVKRLQDTQIESDRLRRGSDLQKHIAELDMMRAAAMAQPTTLAPEGLRTTIESESIEHFADEAESLLRAWHFPNLTGVSFSEAEQDLLISGRLRSTHGKGVRAITHAAFNLALLKHCESLLMAHPGFVSLDSPLVVYRAPDKGERFSPDVKNEFYRSLVGRFSNLQVIVFENEDPPLDISEEANLVRFTKTDVGRSGFIPKR
jgi:hypothetical protein